MMKIEGVTCHFLIYKYTSFRQVLKLEKKCGFFTEIDFNKVKQAFLFTKRKRKKKYYGKTVELVAI